MRYQGPNLNTIIQLEVVDNKTNPNLTQSHHMELIWSCKSDVKLSVDGKYVSFETNMKFLSSVYG